MIEQSVFTADLCDRYEAQVRAGEITVLANVFKNYGGRSSFYGTIATLKIFEDNSLVRTLLESAGEGRVLVIDGAGSLNCALVGDQLALLAARNGWSGIVVYGAIRDAAAIAKTDLGVMALGTHPLKSIKRGTGEANVHIEIAGVTFAPGQFVAADGDGLVLSNKSLID